MRAFPTNRLRIWAHIDASAEGSRARRLDNGKYLRANLIRVLGLKLHGLGTNILRPLDRLRLKPSWHDQTPRALHRRVRRQRRSKRKTRSMAREIMCRTPGKPPRLPAKRGNDIEREIR